MRRERGPNFRLGNERSAQPEDSSCKAKSIRRRAPKGRGGQCFARTPDGGLDLAKQIEAQGGRRGHAPDRSKVAPEAVPPKI